MYSTLHRELQHTLLFVLHSSILSGWRLCLNFISKGSSRVFWSYSAHSLSNSPQTWLIIPNIIANCPAAAAAAAAKSLQSCLTLCDPIDGSPPGSPVPGILQARTRVCCHFLLQCMKVKSESEVTQSCLTLSNPMDCSLPGSSIHGIFQARGLEWGAIAF